LPARGGSAEQRDHSREADDEGRGPGGVTQAPAFAASLARTASRRRPPSTLMMPNRHLAQLIDSAAGLASASAVMPTNSTVLLANSTVLLANSTVLLANATVLPANSTDLPANSTELFANATVLVVNATVLVANAPDRLANCPDQVTNASAVGTSFTAASHTSTPGAVPGKPVAMAATCAWTALTDPRWKLCQLSLAPMAPRFARRARPGASIGRALTRPTSITPDISPGSYCAGGLCRAGGRTRRSDPATYRQGTTRVLTPTYARHHRHLRPLATDPGETSGLESLPRPAVRPEGT